MNDVLKEKIMDRFEHPVNNPRDCELLSEEIHRRTGRNISSTTLRRFFGMLQSKTTLSRYSLDTLAIFCGSADYKSFSNEFGIIRDLVTYDFNTILQEVGQLTRFTLNSISKKSLAHFSETIPRKKVNEHLNAFLSSHYTLIPLIAPGGYGKSIALAHWVKDLITREDHGNIVLFFQAAMLLKTMNCSRYGTNILNLCLSDSRNLIQRFKENRNSNFRRLVLVIDGLDEPDIDNRKISQITSFIRNASSHFRADFFLKIVTGIREVTWEKNILPELPPDSGKWLLFSHIDRPESGYSNLPALSNSEVRAIIDFYNTKQEKPLIYGCVDWRMREMIRIPLNLYFFTNLLSREYPVLEIPGDRLMREYIQILIFDTRFAEEKGDIIWKIVELSLKQTEGFSISKNELKSFYPVHMKRESNYYTAYQDLVAMGILDETVTETKYGTPVTLLQFRHSNFYYYLTALYLSKMNRQITNRLFRNLIFQFQNIEWITNVIAYLYQIAYSNEEYRSLKDFCDLDEAVLSSLPVRHAVGSSFRHNNRIRSRLIEKYASHPAGQLYFFERYVDTNYIFNNFECRIRQYMIHKKTFEAQLFSRNILFLSAFLELNKKRCREQFSHIEKMDPDQNIHPWPTGRKVSSTIINRYILEDDPPEDLRAFIRHYRSIAYSYDHYLQNGVIEFEMSIMIVLVLIEEFKILTELIDHARTHYNLGDPAHEGFSWIHQHQNRFTEIFHDYALYRLKGHFDGTAISKCENILDNYVSVFDDFQYQILMNLFLFEYLYAMGDLDRASSYLEAGLELSRFAGYRFYEVFLLIKGGRIRIDYQEKGMEIIKQSGYNMNASCFFFTIPI